MKTTKKAVKEESPKEEKALATKVETTALSVPDDLDGAWGAEEASGSDIIVPKLLLMAGRSKPVLKGKARAGDIIRSTTQEVLSSGEETISFIPFKMTKSWRISEMVTTKGQVQAQWRGEEQWTPANAELPWDYGVAGKKMRRDYSINFYGLLVADIETEDQPFPVQIKFVRTSKKAGAQIADWFAKSKGMKKPPATKVWSIGSDFIEGADNSYYVFNAVEERLTKPHELRACKFWYDEIASNPSAVKDHVTEDEEGDVITTTARRGTPADDATAAY